MAGTADLLLGAAVAERHVLAEHDGRSGARLERVTLVDGRRLVVKTSTTTDDLTVQLTGGLQRERLLWQSGALDLLGGGVGHPILDVHVEGEQTVTVMRDLGDAVGSWSRVLDQDDCDRVVAALDALHVRFLDTRPEFLCPLETRLSALSPRTMAPLAEEHSLAAAVLRGWELFDQAVGDEVAAAVAQLHDDPAVLAAAMRAEPATLLHADAWPVNMALLDDEVVLIDWMLATEGPPALDLAIFLTGAAEHMAPSREHVIDRFVALSATTTTRSMELALLAGLVDMGWNKALDSTQRRDPRGRAAARQDLDWWVARGWRGLEHLG